MAAQQPSAIPVRFIAFGAEEPRGRGDDLHHFGSQDYVATLSAAQRDAVLAMVSLDRVGVPADAVPVSTGGTGTTAVLDALLAAADSAGVPARQDDQNRASDHWSFEKADIPAARVGSVPYAAYHSADDVSGRRRPRTAGSGRRHHVGLAADPVTPGGRPCLSGPDRAGRRTSGHPATRTKATTPNAAMNETFSANRPSTSAAMTPDSCKVSDCTERTVARSLD